MSPDFEDQLQPEDTLDDRGVDDVLDEGYSPPDREPHELHQAEHETLDERLAEEEPDEVVDPDADEDDFLDDGEVGDARTGRLADSEEGVDGFGDDIGIDGAGASAEEAAVHTIDEPGY